MHGTRYRLMHAASGEGDRTLEVRIRTTYLFFLL